MSAAGSAVPPTSDVPTAILRARSASGLRREILRLAWPVVLQQAYRSVLFYVDMLMVGRLGATAMAAIGVAGPMIWTLSTVLGALAVGTTAVIARNTGAGDAARSRRDAGAALGMAVVAGAACTLAGWFGSPALAELFAIEGSPEATAMSARYMQVVSLGFIPMLVELTGSAVLRGAGNTRVAMLAALVANLLNVAGNYALIFGNWGFEPRGVVGAAISTAIAFGAEGALILAFLFSRASPVRLRPRDLWNVSRESVARILRLSLPAAVEPLILQTGFLGYTRIVTGLGVTSMAAHRAGIAVESASFLPGYGFAIACGAIVGQCLGAAHPAQAERACRETMRITIYLMSVLGIAFLVVPEFLVGLFLPGEPAAIRLGALSLATAAFEQPFMAAAMVLGGALRGAGDTRSPVLVAMVGMWAVRLPMAYLLAVTYGMGLVGIWITMTLDWSVRAVVFWILYKRGRWRTLVV